MPNLGDTLGKDSRSTQHHYVRFETDIIPFRSLFYSLMSNSGIYFKHNNRRKTGHDNSFPHP